MDNYPVEKVNNGIIFLNMSYNHLLISFVHLRSENASVSII